MVCELNLSRNISICVCRMHVLVSSFIQLVDIAESSLDVRLCSGSGGYGDAGSRYGSCRPGSHSLALGEADITQWSGHPSVMGVCVGNSI